MSSGESQNEFEGDPSVKDWVSDLGLSQYEKQILVSKLWLTDNHISVAIILLRRSFLCLNGLQYPTQNVLHVTYI